MYTLNGSKFQERPSNYIVKWQQLSDETVEFETSAVRRELVPRLLNVKRIQILVLWDGVYK